METNEIMNEVIEVTTEEIATANSGKLLKTVGIAGAVAAAGVLAWKFVIKPAVAKIKSKKELAEGVTEDDVEPADLIIVNN